MGKMKKKQFTVEELERMVQLQQLWTSTLSKNMHRFDDSQTSDCRAEEGRKLDGCKCVRVGY